MVTASTTTTMTVVAPRLDASDAYMTTWTAPQDGDEEEDNCNRKLRRMHRPLKNVANNTAKEYRFYLGNNGGDDDANGDGDPLAHGGGVAAEALAAVLAASGH
ncbi:hypothetical protein NL676_033985 [Syzygium grande]|nr:hypothetical protein NL676_033985 [Syzygium grande]